MAENEPRSFDIGDRALCLGVMAIVGAAIFWDWHLLSIAVGLFSVAAVLDPNTSRLM
jgi:hypothetical protein